MLEFSRLSASFVKIFGDMVGAMLSIIPKTLYLIATFAMQIVDLIQVLFQKLAGLDVYYVKGSNEPQTGDFLVYFLRKVLFEKSTLNTVFWSIVIVGLFLLVFATIVAVIRTQYNYDEKPVSPTKVVGKAIKSLITFAIVPIVAFFGVYLGNIFLNALNNATTVSQSTPIGFSDNAQIKLEPYKLADGSKTYRGLNLFGTDIAIRQDTFSGMVFRSAAHRANRIRNDADFRAICDGSKETMAGTIYSGVTFGMFQVNQSDYETAANRLDDAFVYNYKLDQYAYVNWSANVLTSLTMSVGVLFGDWTAVLYATPYKTFSRYNVAWVWFYYDLWQFDYVLAVIAIIFCTTSYFNITSAMMRRAIELTMLMVVSPGVVAVTPLDNGAMLKRWRESFIKKTLSAYGAVVGVNLLFIILPYINEINFFENIAIANSIVQMLFTIVGLACVKDFMKMMSELVGGEDAQAIGGETNKKVGEAAMQAGKAIATVASPVAKAALKVTPAGKAVSAVAKGFKSRAGRYSRFTSDLSEREKNHEIRRLKREDKKLGRTRSDAEYESLADSYMNSAAGKNAVKKREAHRADLKTISAAMKSPLKFLESTVGYGMEQSFDPEGKFFGAIDDMKKGKTGTKYEKARSDAQKSQKEKEEADQATQREKDQLSATQRTNDLLDGILSKM